MLRLDYILMRGVINESGEKLEWEGGLWFVKSFANRNNDGKQPVPDDFPVVISWPDSYCTEKVTASEVRWEFDIEWKPDFDELLEQQNEYDKQQEKPIEEIMINAKESKMSKFKEHQEVFVEGHSKVEWVFGCYTVEAGRCIVLSEGSHMVMSIDRVSDKPFKSDYELKKEQLMKEQIQKASKLLTNKGFGHDQILLKCLQSNGFFAEIIMPLGFEDE